MTTSGERLIENFLTGTRVGASTASVILLAANNDRNAFSIYNDSSAILYVRIGGSTSSTSDFSFKLFQDDYYESVLPCPTGSISGVWTVATGSAYMTSID